MAMLNLPMAPSFLLHQPELHPLLPSIKAAQLGTTVVVAPHPDDESLGCGGLLALLEQEGISPQVIIMTDGALSHPASLSYPQSRLAALRETEALAAITTLGLPAKAIHFLRLHDGGLPSPDDPVFMEVAAKIRALLLELAPDTLLVPWRRDPHSDHRATWRLLRVAATSLAVMPSWLEYPVWAWAKVDSDDAPACHEGNAWRIDISAVQSLKQRAIEKYRSQLGKLIHDDPSGFVLQPEMLAHFVRPWELFISPLHV